MGEAPLTLMAVHAHPDDEASSTGGILARYSAEGIRTVVVTCTNGELGDGHETSKPGEEGHDEDWVVATRRGELERSCELLGVTALEMLGYRDSGMMGWPQNDAVGSFWQDQSRRQQLGSPGSSSSTGRKSSSPMTPTAFTAILITFKRTGLRSQRWTRRRYRTSSITRNSQVGHGGVQRDAPQRRGSGTGGSRRGLGLGIDDDVISTVVDCSDYVTRQYAALEAHASQGDGTFFLQLGVDLFSKLMSREMFVRAFDRTGAPTPEDDLFAGLRP